MNGSDLTLLVWHKKRLSRNTVSWLPPAGGRQHCSSVKIHKKFLERTRSYLARSTHKRLVGILPRLLENLVCGARARRKTALQFTLIYLAASFDKDLADPLPRVIGKELSRISPKIAFSTFLPLDSRTSASQPIVRALKD